VETMLQKAARARLLGIVFGTFLASSAVHAQSDTRSIRIIVGFGPASTADVAARILSKEIERDLGVPVIVENRPGNSSMLAADYVARAPNDGKTLFMGTVANTLYLARDAAGFDLATKLQPVSLVGSVPNVLVANPSMAPKTFGDLVADAKAKPQSYTFGSSGQGTAGYLGIEMFNVRAGTKIVSVPYEGSHQALTDILGGQINLMWGAANTIAPYVADGKLRALAVGQNKRTAFLPDVPAMSEVGMPDFDIGIWMGLLAPAGTPMPVVERISTAVRSALAREAVQSAFRQQGVETEGMAPDEFKAFVRADFDKWKRVLDETELNKSSNN
jgi:tripartite-type tricarboxylate transporter receptor subunit TctC